MNVKTMYIILNQWESIFSQAVENEMTLMQKTLCRLLGNMNKTLDGDFLKKDLLSLVWFSFWKQSEDSICKLVIKGGEVHQFKRST